MKPKFFAHLREGTFVRNVLTVTTGSAFAQAISMGLSVILARIFSPADFGSYALYLVIPATVGVVATGRYEMAIPLPEADEDARTLLMLALGIPTVVSVLLMVVILLACKPIAGFLGDVGLTR